MPPPRLHTDASLNKTPPAPHGRQPFAFFATFCKSLLSSPCFLRFLLFKSLRLDHFHSLHRSWKIFSSNCARNSSLGKSDWVSFRMWPYPPSKGQRIPSRPSATPPSRRSQSTAPASPCLLLPRIHSARSRGTAGLGWRKVFLPLQKASFSACAWAEGTSIGSPRSITFVGPVGLSSGGNTVSTRCTVTLVAPWIAS